MTTVLKLGGSAITVKEEPETVDRAALERAGSAIADGIGDDERLVVVHGGGSFGHHHAAHHGVTEEAGTHDPDGVLAIHRAMGRLNDEVVDTLRGTGLAALPVRPLSFASRDRDGHLSVPADAVETMLGDGFLPVVQGDVIAHEGTGATILSGDDIVVSLARSLRADRVGLCSMVPGVLDAEGAVIEEIDSYDAVADVLGGSEATDVTGGMAGKVRRLLELEAPASIFDLAALPTFLDAGAAGTVVR